MTATLAPELESPPPARARRNHAALTSSLVLGVVLAACAWPSGADTLVPQQGLDHSWMAALAMAADRRMHFGTEFIFTYGPLGFLSVRKLYVSWTAALSFGFYFGLDTAIFAVLISTLRTRLRLLVACLVAFVCGYPLVAMWRGSEGVLAVMFVVSIRALSRARDATFARWTWIAFGSVTGFMALQKVSVGVGVGLLAVLTVAFAPTDRWRAALHVTTCAVAVFVVGWFATGNGFGNLPAYVRGSRDISAGFSAMATDPSPGHRGEIWLAISVGLVLIATAVVYARRLVPVRRAAIGVVTAAVLVSWILFKEGFVRQDGHRVVFFASMPVLFAAFAFDAHVRVPRNRFPVWLVVASLLFAPAVVFEVRGSIPPRLFAPPLAWRDLGDSALTLAWPARRDTMIANARADMVRYYHLPPEMEARMAGQTVDIDPSEQALAFAYPEIRWRPLPTIQNYSAYTTGADQLDVDFVNSSRAPQLILRTIPASVDRRLPFFDAPSTQLAILCNYREAESSGAWQLLERVPNRCGEMRDLGSQRHRVGQVIAVPAPPAGSIVVASFDLDLPLRWRVLDLLYKPSALRIEVNRQPPLRRFVVGTASGLHIVATPSNLAYGPDFTPRQIHSMALHFDDGSTPTVTLHFSAVPLR